MDRSDSHLILIVEDAALQREVLRRVLERAGLRALPARDGQEGLELAREQRPDLIISDISMPRMDGYAMCREIKNDPVLKAIPVILLTELSDPREIIRGLNAGADNYITKPYDETDLIHRVRQLLSGKGGAHGPAIQDESGLEVSFAGEQHTITSNRQQILNLLLSTYEEAVQRNLELQRAQLELKLLNENLEAKVRERTRQLEVANRAKTAFIANMSHELRTPLNAVIGMTDLVLSGRMEYEQRKYLGVVKHSSESLLDLLNNLIDFARLETGQLQVSNLDFNLREQLLAISRPFLAKSRDKGLSFILAVRSDVPDKLRGDAGRLKGILAQLLGNAIKFTTTGNVILDVAQLGKWEQGNLWLYFSVMDTGVGIAAEEREMAFESFVQGDGSSTRKYGGTGIGLSLARSLATVISGKIEFLSAKGFGSVFALQVPFAVTDPASVVKDGNELLIDHHSQEELSCERHDGEEDITALAPLQLAREGRNRLALFRRALEESRTELVEHHAYWLRRAIGVIGDDAMRGELLRMVMAARKADLGRVDVHLEQLHAALQRIEKDGPD